MEVLVVCVILLHVSQHVSAVEGYEGESVLLPCEFYTYDMDEPSVTWSRDELCSPAVHQRQMDGDQLKDQNQRYRGRTSMETDALETGDLRLKLTQLQFSDSGNYTCTITEFGRRWSRIDVELKVKERFPSWVTAVVVLLVLLVVVLIVAVALYVRFRLYFKSVYKVEVDSGSESVLLPCKTFKTFFNKDVTVEWMDLINRMVHVYQNDSDRPGDQDQIYRNRTEMKKDLQRTGDLSLILKYPTYWDSKIFTCTVYNRDRKILMEKQVFLQVKVQQVEVDSGVESVLLPWKTTLHLPEDVRVVWWDRDNRMVHVYQNNSDRPEDQNQIYRNRTEMKKNLQRTGDLSLILKHPTESDRGTFTCSVFNRNSLLLWKQVVLKVKEKLQVEDETVSLRNGSRSTDPTPLMTDQPV